MNIISRSQIKQTRNYRTVISDGMDELEFPQAHHIELHREILSIYLKNLKEIQDELRATLHRIAIDQTVVVMTVNKGQSELFLNFVCHAKSKGFNLKNILLVPTDQFSKNLADELGLATFYNEHVSYHLLNCCIIFFIFDYICSCECTLAHERFTVGRSNDLWRPKLWTDDDGESHQCTTCG